MKATLRTLRRFSCGRSTRILGVVLILASCRANGIDASAVAPISNDDTYATLGYLWSGVKSSIEREREPSTDTFSLALAFQLPCARGGSGAYQGTLAGTKANGIGTANLNVTATLAECQFDESRITITRISAAVLTVTGTVAIVNDAWDAINLHMVATAVTVNGVACPGGVDVTLIGTSPSASPVSTGTACGRTGAVALP
ncbi:MAG: hypothetical protein ABI910_23620 [Gemmatimonadota bacterium]